MATQSVPNTVAALSDESARLAQQYTEIAVLAGGLAHEIRNPLSTIRLNLDLLAEDLEGSEAPRDRRALTKIAVLQRECKHLNDILDDFLRYARIGDVRCQPADLNAVLQELLDFYAPQALQQKVDILPYLAGDLPPVPLDHGLFQRALLNLVFNAQQAMPQGGQLTVRTYLEDGQVKLDLIDTGCGMDADTLQHVFQPFYSTKREGTGLGMPTTRKIVQAHGGTIRVQSEPGRGSRITISLAVTAPTGP